MKSWQAVRSNPQKWCLLWNPKQCFHDYPKHRKSNIISRDLAVIRTELRLILISNLDLFQCSLELTTWWRLQLDTHLVNLSCRCRRQQCASLLAWVVSWSWAVCLPPRYTSSCSNPRRMWSRTGFTSTGSVSAELPPHILSVSMEITLIHLEMAPHRDPGQQAPTKHACPYKESQVSVNKF